ncbi:MAG: NAD-dependent epimerase/dehydratase family protein [Lachnospiraceae bacterium]|nr:NAD-dependent epimerase/dehydratase family protein [Lachnospiraceae bacterium]
MKILVIGGSYFFGRWFVQVTYKDHDITLLNRGNIKTGLLGVRELVCDRHDITGLKELDLSREAYDVVVDFCAYEKGDIELILKNLDTQALRKYIFISTVDVYERTGGTIGEDSALTGDFAEGPEGDYIRGKTGLERELAMARDKYGIRTVSVRPAVLYGPMNYAPRESIYFEWIDKAGQIIHPLDSDGFWQMIYVGDAARALRTLCELPDEETLEAYNFCNGDRITYDVFEEALRSTDKPFERVDIPVDEVDDKFIPLPFPLRASESAYYASDRFNGLLSEHTPLKEGLLRTRQV